MPDFIERRKEYRLPYEEKVIFTEGKQSFTGYASNISRGGLFVTSLEPFPIETKGYISFMVPALETSLCVKAKIVHIVFDRQRCEIDNGMGFMFMELTQAQKQILNDHIENEQATYMELKSILSAETPDATRTTACLARLPHLRPTDLLSLRYKVNRICTLFEGVPQALPLSQKLSA